MLVGFERQCSAIFVNIVMVSIIYLLVLIDCGDKPGIVLKKNLLETHMVLRVDSLIFTGPC